MQSRLHGSYAVTVLYEEVDVLYSIAPVKMARKVITPTPSTVSVSLNRFCMEETSSSYYYHSK